MSQTDGYFIVFLIIVLSACFAGAGFLDGKKEGAKEACQSVKLEWVQDKCMKVTREAV